MTVGKVKVLLPIAIVALLVGFPIYQEVSYRNVGERLEDYSVLSTQPHFEKEVAPVLAGRFLDSLEDRVIGYEYSPYYDAYVLYVKGKVDGSNENHLYAGDMEVLSDQYERFLRVTAREFAGYLSTGNETLLRDAMLDAYELVIIRAHIESMKRWENVTAVILKRGRPLSSMLDSLSFLKVLLLSLVALGVGIAAPFFAFDLWDKYGIKLILAVLIVALLSWGLFHVFTSHGEPLEDFGRAGNLSMNCQGLEYGVELNGGAEKEILRARDYALAYAPWGEKGVVFVFRPEDASRFLDGLKRRTLVLGMWNSSSVAFSLGDNLDEYSVKNLDRISEKVVRDLVNISGGRISDEDARTLLKLTRENYLASLVKRVPVGNCTRVRLLFNAGP